MEYIKDITNSQADKTAVKICIGHGIVGYISEKLTYTMDYNECLWITPCYHREKINQHFSTQHKVSV